MTRIKRNKKGFGLEMKTRDTHIAYNTVACLYIHRHKKFTNYLNIKYKKYTMY